MYSILAHVLPATYQTRSNIRIGGSRHAALIAATFGLEHPVGGNFVTSSTSAVPDGFACDRFTAEPGLAGDPLHAASAHAVLWAIGRVTPKHRLAASRTAR